LISIRFMMHSFISVRHRPMTGQRCRNLYQKTKGMGASPAVADQGRGRCVGAWTGASRRTGLATERGRQSGPGDMKCLMRVTRLSRTGSSQRRQSIHISINQFMVGVSRYDPLPSPSWSAGSLGIPYSWFSGYRLDHWGSTMPVSQAGGDGPGGASTSQRGFGVL